MKVRILRFSGTVLTRMLGAGEHHYKVNNPLPDDAQVVSVRQNLAVGCFDVYVVSEKFEDMPEGEEPTKHGISFTTIEPSEKYVNGDAADWDSSSL